MTKIWIAGVAATALTAIVAIPAQATSAGDILLRVRAIVVAPEVSSGDVSPVFPGEKVNVDNSSMPEVDLTYFATDHIGFELIAATTKHHIYGTTGTTGSIGRLASTWVLPPTLTAQYHFLAKVTFGPTSALALTTPSSVVARRRADSLRRSDRPASACRTDLPGRCRTASMST